MLDISEEKLEDIKSAILSELKEEILNEYDIPVSKWNELLELYAQCRTRLDIESTTYEAILGDMYRAKKSLDTMRF